MKTSTSLIRCGFALAALLCALASRVAAQPGSLDTSFNAGPAIAGEVGSALVIQPDGKVIAAGTFGLMRFLTDGSVDNGFNPAALGTYAHLTLQTDGRLILSGAFTNGNGAPLPALLRLNSNGSLDSSFNLDAGVYPSAGPVALQPDGKLLTGAFLAGDDDEYSGLVRLLPDGSLDPDFDRSPYRDVIHFSVITVDGITYLGSGNLALQSDGKLLVGGYGDGPDFRALSRSLPDGTGDPDWMPPAFGGGDHTITAVLVQPDGKVLVAGNNLQSINGFSVANVGRLHPDGSVDTTFDSLPESYYYDPKAMAFGPDGSVYVAGQHNVWPNLSAGPGVWRLHNENGLQPRLAITFTPVRGITLRLSGYAGARYRLEYREQVTSGAWTLLTTVTLSGPTADLPDTGWTSSSTRFYRAVFAP